jgi:hypothetical protein
MFFFYLWVPSTTHVWFFFLLSYMLACLACFVWLSHKAIHDVSTIIHIIAIIGYSRLFPLLPFVSTYLLIIVCSCLHYNKRCPCMPSDFTTFWVYSLFSEHGTSERHSHFVIVLLSSSSPPPTCFCHYRLFRFFTCISLLHCLLSLSPPFTCFYLLHCLYSPSPPSFTCYCQCRLFLLVFTIATYLFSPSLPTPTYFHHCHLPVFAITPYSRLLLSLSPL